MKNKIKISIYNENYVLFFQMKIMVKKKTRCCCCLVQYCEKLYNFCLTYI